MKRSRARFNQGVESKGVMGNEFGRPGFPERPFSFELNRRPLKMAILSQCSSKHSVKGRDRKFAEFMDTQRRDIDVIDAPN